MRVKASIDGPARTRSATGGFSITEVVVVLAAIGLLSTLLVPPIFRLTGRLRVQLAAAEIVGTIRMARTYAIRNGENVGLKFFPSGGGRVGFALYRDGDGDGVRTDDLRRGVDPLVMMRRDLSHLGGRVGFGFPDGIVPRQPSNTGRMTRLDDPIRFNRSDMVSFSPLGTSTPGSLYLSDGYHLFAIRVMNRTGKVTVFRYDRERELWR